MWPLKIKKPIVALILLTGTSTVFAEPEMPSVAERGRMGLTAYDRALDALEVPESERFPISSGKPRKVSTTLIDAMDRARAAQKQALEGEDQRFGYMNKPPGE